MRTASFTTYLPHYPDPDVAMEWMVGYAKKLGFNSEARARSSGWTGDLNPVKVTIIMEPIPEQATLITSKDTDQ